MLHLRSRCNLLSIVVFFVGIVTPATAAETWKVATKSFDPFVFISPEEPPKGYSIELWDKITSRLEIQSEFVVFNTIDEVLNAVESGEVDAAISGISITAKREEAMDFSHSYYKSGLQIMILEGRRHAGLTFIRLIFSRETGEALAVLFCFCLISAHLLWIVERHYDPDMFPKSYLTGVWEALWWSLVTATTVGYGDKTPSSFIGRLIAMFWMLAGLFVVGYFTSAITVNRLQTAITGPEDLPGKRVAAVAGTTSANYLRSQLVKLIEFKQIEDAYTALKQGEVEAIVYDAPTLLYSASQEPDFRVVGRLFEQQDYGIALPEDSPNTEMIDRIILQLKEEGAIAELDDKWFPASE